MKREYTGKFKVGDKVNAIGDEEDFSVWRNATIVEVDHSFQSYPYSCICDHYGDQWGLFSENELELAEAE